MKKIKKKDNGKEIHSEDTIKNDESMDHKSTSINAITSRLLRLLATILVDLNLQKIKNQKKEKEENNNNSYKTMKEKII